MTFEVGQTVIIRRNLGTRLGYPKEYYHGGTPKDIPIGSQGVVEDVYEKNVHVRLKNGKVCEIHPDELVLNEEYQRKADSLLVKVLLKKERPKKPVKETPAKGEREFNPTFNVREEFAVWVKKEFPKLGIYAGNYWMYGALDKRRDEVYEAAKSACKHGIRTGSACVREAFRDIYDDLKDSYKCKANSRDFCKDVNKLITWIEKCALNLKSKGKKHYNLDVEPGSGR